MIAHRPTEVKEAAVSVFAARQRWRNPVGFRRSKLPADVVVKRPVGSSDDGARQPWAPFAARLSTTSRERTENKRTLVIQITNGLQLSVNRVKIPIHFLETATSVPLIGFGKGESRGFTVKKAYGTRVRNEWLRSDRHLK